MRLWLVLIWNGLSSPWFGPFHAVSWRDKVKPRASSLSGRRRVPSVNPRSARSEARTKDVGAGVASATPSPFQCGGAEGGEGWGGGGEGGGGGGGGRAGGGVGGGRGAGAAGGSAWVRGRHSPLGTAPGRCLEPVFWQVPLLSRGRCLESRLLATSA